MSNDENEIESAEENKSTVKTEAARDSGRFDDRNNVNSGIIVANINESLILIHRSIKIMTFLQEWVDVCLRREIVLMASKVRRLI